MRFFWYLMIACAALAACAHTDTSAGVPFPGGPPSNACSTGTTVALVDPLPGTTNVPTQVRRVVIASSPGIRISRAGLVLVSAQKAGGNLGPRELVGPIPSPTTSPAPPTPFPSPLYYAAQGFRLKPNHAYYVDVAVLGSSCTPTRISGARFETAPY